MPKCEDCLHKNVCIDSANYRSAESCRHYETVKRGHWIPSENKTFICSECGYGFEHEGYIHFFNFCPGCGVRIEGVMDKTDTIAEKPFAILNCPECGGEVDMGKMNFCTGKKSASALFECKKCHYYRTIMTEYTNNPQTALIQAWNDYVVSREAYKTVKSAAEEINPNGVPVDCVKCRFYNGHLEYCRKHSAKTLPFCFCYDGEEREYHIKVNTDDPMMMKEVSNPIAQGGLASATDEGKDYIMGFRLLQG